MAAFAGFFDFSTQRTAEGVSGDGSKWCFIEGLTLKWKILSDLGAPIGMVTICGALFILSKFVFRKRIRIKRKKVNFQAAALAVFLFILGKVLDTLFKTIACRPVGGYTVHWYFAYEDCYGSTWIMSVSVLMAIMIVFGGVFVWGWRMTAEDRADPNKFMYQLASRFKPEYWYWEYVIFVRRILVSWFAVGVSAVLAKLIFLFIMIGFTVIQWRTDPFSNPESNQVCYAVACFGCTCVLS